MSNADSFATYYRDSTGLDYANERNYSSAVGRFTTVDESGEANSLLTPGSFNSYRYTLADPVNQIDPSGNAEITASAIDFSFLGFPSPPFYQSWWNLTAGLVDLRLFQYPIIVYTPAPPAAGVAASATPLITSTGQAAAATRSALTSPSIFSGNCISKLTRSQKFTGDLRTALMDKVGSVKFWDARPAQQGLLTADIIVPGYAGYRLVDILPGAKAYVLPTASGQITNNIVLKENFFRLAREDQNITLIHELLHYFFNLDTDAKLAVALGATSGADVSAWIKKGCQ